MTELTPPDLDRCQAEKPGAGPFALGGETGNPLNGYLIRCRHQPAWIAAEKNPGDDGQQGSMSLCDACRKVCEAQSGVPAVYFEEIEP